MKPNIERLGPQHDLSSFDCGSEPLNRYLKSFASANQASGSATTYLALAENTVAGYYSLAVGSIAHDDAPVRMKKGLARHAIPIMLLARLGVDHAFHGQGLGKGLLLDGLRRTVQVADIAGLRAVVVHAKDDQARAFYEHFGFELLPGQSLTLFRLLKDIRALMRH